MLQLLLCCALAQYPSYEEDLNTPTRDEQRILTETPVKVQEAWCTAVLTYTQLENQAAQQYLQSAYKFCQLETGHPYPEFANCLPSRWKLIHQSYTAYKTALDGHTHALLTARPKVAPQLPKTVTVGNVGQWFPRGYELTTVGKWVVRKSGGQYLYLRQPSVQAARPYLVCTGIRRVGDKEVFIIDVLDGGK